MYKDYNAAVVSHLISELIKKISRLTLGQQFLDNEWYSEKTMGFGTKNINLDLNPDFVTY